MSDYDPDTTYKISIGPALTQKIPPGSPYWHDFNGSFVNREVKHAEFANYVYFGHTFTTWHKDKWRNAKNYVAGQHLGIDMDTGDKRSAVDTLLNDPFIAKYAGLVYTTPSHTDEEPRARVVFLLDAPIQQAANYALSASALLWLFGSADRQCKDAARFFYGGKSDGRVEWLPNVLPLAIVKDMIARYKATGQQEKRTISHYTGQTADEQKVQAALKCIPPLGIEYDEWVSILMAIHAEFPGPNGQAIAEAWAQGYPGEVAHKWKSFNGGGNTAGRVGIGTLFAMAKQHGYRPQLSV